MSGGLPDAKPWASCCPRSEATTTFTLMPVCFVKALAALLTAKVSAGPELPISAVSVVAWLLVGEPTAAPTVDGERADHDDRQRRGASGNSGCAMRMHETSSLGKLSRTTNEPADAITERPGSAGSVWLSPPFGHARNAGRSVIFGTGSIRVRRRAYDRCIQSVKACNHLTGTPEAGVLLARIGIASGSTGDDRATLPPAPASASAPYRAS